MTAPDDKKLIERLRAERDEARASLVDAWNAFSGPVAEDFDGIAHVASAAGGDLAEQIRCLSKQRDEAVARLEALTAPQVEVAPVDGDVAKDFLAKLAFCPSTDRGIDYEARDWRNRTRLTLYGEWAEFCMWVIDHQGRLLSALTHPATDRGELGVRQPTDAMVKAAATEFLSHKGERPYRITRRGAERWEDDTPAMRAALTAALAKEAK